MPISRFKQFALAQDRCAMKIGTDGVLLGAWASCEEANTILDIGTGTGLIALMLAQRNLLAKIDAVEINADAAQQATENMQQSPWANRLTVFTSSLQIFAQEKKAKKYDLIVSNPPFFSNSLHSPKSKSRNQARHTDTLSFSDLLLYTSQLLSLDGHFCLILPCKQASQIEEMAFDYDLFCEKKLFIYPKKTKKANRCLLQFSRHAKKQLHTEILILRDASNKYTKDYQQLTCQFHPMY